MTAKLGIQGWEAEVVQIAIASIQTYKQYISPHKGYACAHRLLYGGESCSDYVKQSLRSERLEDALKQSFRRFQACRTASETLRTMRSQSGCIIIPCCLPCPPL